MTEDSRNALFIGESEVRDFVDFPTAVDLVRNAFLAEAEGTCHALEKTLLGFGERGTLHSLGAAGESVVGVKSWAHTPGGADPQLLLFDSQTGQLLAVIEAFVLGQLRTAATAAVATDALASQSAEVLGIIGTGKQALGQVAAVLSVRSVRQVRAFSRNSENRERFARLVESELEVECDAVESAEAAVDGADVITLVTRSTTPVIGDDAPSPGAHINAVGAIDLNRAEFVPAMLERCQIIATDSVAQAQNLSSELREYFAPLDWSGLYPLSDLLAGRTTPRQGDLTLFKGMGSGIEDLALGAEVLRIARSTGAGRVIQLSAKVQPRFKRKTSP